MNIQKLFSEQPRPPFSVSLRLDNIDGDTKFLFHSIKNIFLKGLVIIRKEFDLHKLNIDILQQEDLLKISNYMLSMGIKVIHKKYDVSRKDYLYRCFLMDLEKIPELSLKILTNWRTDNIEKIHISFPNMNEEVNKKYNFVLDRNFETNHFLNLRKPKQLRDYAILIKHDNVTDIIYFDFAQHQ